MNQLKYPTKSKTFIRLLKIARALDLFLWKIVWMHERDNHLIISDKKLISRRNVPWHKHKIWSDDPDLAVQRAIKHLFTL